MSIATDLAWLAGILDGEGCIHINRQRASQRMDLKTDSFRLYVQVAMGHRPTLERCLQIAKVGSIQSYTGSAKWNPSFIWMTNGRNAVGVLKKCQKYLTTKRYETSLALEFALLKPWLRGGRNGNTAKPDWLVDKMNMFYWKLRMAKSRWRFYRKKLKLGDKTELRRLGLKF